MNRVVWAPDFDAMVFPQAMGLDALLTSHPIEVEVREKLDQEHRNRNRNKEGRQKKDRRTDRQTDTQKLGVL